MLAFYPLNIMPLTSTSYKISSSARTDIGLFRENNEDVWAALPEEHVYLLADGMGGHAAGEIAAQRAIEVLSALIKKSFGLKKKKPQRNQEAFGSFDTANKRNRT